MSQMLPPISQLPTFVHLAEFDADSERLGQSDVELRQLQIQLVGAPESGKVIAKAGGLRKLRFGLPGKGKSGSIRVCYARFPAHFVLLLVTAYGDPRRWICHPPTRRPSRSC